MYSVGAQGAGSEIVTRVQDAGSKFHPHANGLSSLVGFLKDS